MEGETEHQVKTGRQRSIVIVAISIACVLGSAGLYLFARDTYSENQIRRLIASAYNSQRPGGGRLSDTPYSLPNGGRDVQANLGQAQLHLLRYPDSDTRQRLQCLIYLASGNWQNYVDTVAHFSAKMRNEP